MDCLLVFDVLRFEAIQLFFVMLVLAVPIFVLVALGLQFLLFFFKRGSLSNGAL